MRRENGECLHLLLASVLTSLELAGGGEAGGKDRGSADTSNVFIKTKLLGPKKSRGCVETVATFIFIIVRFPHQDVRRVKEGAIPSYTRSVG